MADLTWTDIKNYVTTWHLKETSKAGVTWEAFYKTLGNQSLNELSDLIGGIPRTWEGETEFSITSGVVDLLVPAALQDFGGLPIRVKSDGTGTQQVGVIGKNSVGTTVYDVVALSATNTVDGVVGMAKVIKFLVGPVPHPGDATDRHPTLRIGPLTYGSAECTLQDLGAMDNGRGRVIDPLFRYLHWCLTSGTAAASGGIADWLKLAVWG